jgi:hypothetical protein
MNHGSPDLGIPRDSIRSQPALANTHNFAHIEESDRASSWPSVQIIKDTPCAVAEEGVPIRQIIEALADRLGVAARGPQTTDGKLRQVAALQVRDDPVFLVVCRLGLQAV